MMKLYLQDSRWGETSVYRQTSQFSGLIGDAYWSSFPDYDYDFAVCSDPSSLPQALRQLPRSRIVYVYHENPQFYSPTLEFLQQFGIVISPWTIPVPTTCLFIQTHSANPWFYGIPFKTDQGTLHCPLNSTSELDALNARDLSSKPRLASFITSSKAFLPGHQWRISVANMLASKYPGLVDIYGFGHNPLQDKSSALDPYKFTIAIENCASEHYWTEKLSDALIGGCIPIYSGASLAHDQLGFGFPSIPFGCDPDYASTAIAQFLATYVVDNAQLQSARDRVLNHHNFMSWIPFLLSRSF